MYVSDLRDIFLDIIAYKKCMGYMFIMLNIKTSYTNIINISNLLYKKNYQIIIKKYLKIFSIKAHFLLILLFK